MDANEIKELMRFISDSNFVEFEMEQEGFKLRLIKEGARAASTPVLAPGTAGDGRLQSASSSPSQSAGQSSPAPATAPVEQLHELHSPIVGTFYRSPSPDAQPYVEVGDRVKKGQVICIVEAMKLMNEIESDVAGEIVAALPANGQPVEYGEILFRIRPAG